MDEVRTSSIEDKSEVFQMFKETSTYMLSHNWCYSVENVRFGGGFAQVGVFFLTAHTTDGPIPHWVIVGDLPPLYLDTCDGEVNTAAKALDTYIYAMRMWVDRWSGGRSYSEVPPVVSKGDFRPITPTKDHVEMLSNRLNFLQSNVIPFLMEEYGLE